MRIAILFSPDCPNWAEGQRRLRLALEQVGLPAIDIELVEVSDDAEAARTGFAGSPTFTADGVDLFDTTGSTAGLTCRVYRTEAGTLAGVPDVTDLITALRKQVR